MVSCNVVTDAPLARIQENEVSNSQRMRRVLGQYSKLPWMIRFWDMSNIHNKRMPYHFLVFGTLFHKVIVVQLSGSRNTVFAEVL